MLAGLTPGKPPKDSDHDGISDHWEDAHGLDKLKDDSTQPQPSGYTAIEEYLNTLAATLIASSEPPALRGNKTRSLFP